MIRNYFKTTIRNFLRNRNYSVINILGLSIGITSCIIIFLLVSYDLSFDHFHSKRQSIFRVVKESETSSGHEFSSATPYPFAKSFRNDFPHIPLVTQLHFEEDALLRIDDTKLVVENLIFADSLFFEVFDFKVLQGNPRLELGHHGKAFVTKSLAEKLGYDVNKPEPLRLKVENRVDVEVVGVLEDCPANSHIQFSMVVSMPSLNDDFIGGMSIDSWSLTSAGYSYIVLPESEAAEKLEEQFKGMVNKYYEKRDSERTLLHLQPLDKIHFDERYTGNPSQTQNASYKELIILCILGGFILVIACINFVNLSTALAVRKSKEIGIRKTLGASRSQLTLYFIGETFMITLAAILISLGVSEWITPWINGFIQKKISLNLFSNFTLMIFLACLAVFTTVLSGFYPALILSGFNPVSVLKNKLSAHGSSGAQVRKILVICQFMIAQILIMAVLIIADQMEYFKNKPLGFDKEAVVLVDIPEPKKDKLEAFRSRLESYRDIESVSFSLGAPTSDNNFGTNYFLSENASKELFDIGVKPVDRHYLETYGIELKEGRWFTEADEKLADNSLPEDQQKYVYVINESAARRLGFATPTEIIGKNITTGINRINAEVVGVVNDFHSASLHNEINPIVFMNFPYFYYEAGIKVSTNQLQQTLKFIEDQWSDLYPDYYFKYSFLDQKLEALYRQEERTFTLIRIFAGVSIFIGCLGLYGLVSFMANQKLKEVGIRKVLGASVRSIVFLFSRDFVVLILIAFAVAAPLGWYVMKQWLETFPYHISVHWSVFVISIVVTLAIALFTVSYRSIRAAITNPSDILRTE